MPHRFHFKEESAIAGIFRIDIQLTGIIAPRTTGVVPSCTLLTVGTRGFRVLAK